MAEAPEGSREDTLLRIGRLLGGYVAGGELPYGLAHDELWAAATKCGLPDHEIAGKLPRHIEHGMSEPLTAPKDNATRSAPSSPKLWRATELKPAVQQQWLAKRRLQRAAINLLIGDEGIGKSLLWVWVTAAVTTGKPLPEFGIPARDPATVIVVVTEDNWQDTVLPRLTVAGADLEMISVICTEDDGSGAPVFPRDLHLIEDAAPALVVVDAWLDTVPSKLNVKDPQDARQALHPWKDVATKTDAAILLLCHTNRTTSAKARDRYGTTGELRKSARMCLFAQQDEDGRLLVGPDKTNSSAPVAAAAFSIAAIQQFPPTEDDDGTVPTLTYVGETDRTAGQHIADAYEDDKTDRQDRTAAERWLGEYLHQNPGDKSAEVKREARKAGIADRTLQRARQTLEVVVEYTGMPAVTTWTLP